MKWYAPLLFLLVGALLSLLPALRSILDFPRFYLIFLYFIFFWIAQATSWNMLSGYSGYFSFGQGAFYGIGVYTTAVLLHRTEIPFLATLPIGGILSVIIGLIIGVIVFRLRKLRGELFALLTLAVDLVLAAVARTTDVIDGGFGIPLGRVPYPEFLGDFTEMVYRLGLVISLLTVFTAYAIYHSRFGRGLFAIHDDEEVAESLGVPTFRYKLLILAVTAFFGAVAGGLHALQIGYVTVEGVFSIRIPLLVILMCVLGGRRHWLGPVIGAIIIYTLNDTFSSADQPYLNSIAIGSLLIIMILFVREGIFERLRTRLIPSLAILTIALIVQFLFPAEDVRLTTQLATAMMLMIGLLLIPHKWYETITFQNRLRSAPQASD